MDVKNVNVTVDEEDQPLQFFYYVQSSSENFVDTQTNMGENIDVEVKNAWCTEELKQQAQESHVKDHGKAMMVKGNKGAAGSKWTSCSDWMKKQLCHRCKEKEHF